MTLISVLIEFNILEVYRLTRKKFKLFSKQNPFDKEKNEDDFEAPFKDYNVDAFLDLENLCVDLLPFHVPKYCQLQKTMSNLQQSACGDSKSQANVTADSDKLGPKRWRKLNLKVQKCLNERLWNVVTSETILGS